MATRLIVVSGKGGVGKSSVAAALALAARRRGQRVLAIDMLDGGGLGPHLGEPEVTFRPKMLAEGLEVSTIDRADALIEYLRVQLGIPTLATMGPAARAFDALASTAPAVREVVTMGKVLWEVRKDVYDVVVADGPPTGQVGSYLGAARTIRELVAAGRILDQVAWMEDILTGPTTELILVTLLEELPTIETAEALDWVERQRPVGTTRVVANRTLAPLGAELPAADGPVAEAAALHDELWAEQRSWAKQIPVDTFLPYLFGTHTPNEVAERLTDALEEAQ